MFFWVWRCTVCRAVKGEIPVGELPHKLDCPGRVFPEYYVVHEVV